MNGFDEFYQLNYPWVVRYILRLCPHADADAIAQEVFMYCLRRGTTALPLRLMAQQKLSRWSERERKRRQTPIESAEEVAAAPVSDPDQYGPATALILETGSIAAAADAAGVHRTTIWRKARSELGIE